MVQLLHKNPALWNDLGFFFSSYTNIQHYGDIKECKMVLALFNAALAQKPSIIEH